MGVAENMETVKRFYGAGPAGDDTARQSFFAPDAVWHVPGDNPVSGPYHGVQGITVDMPAKMQPLDEWRIDPRHVMGNGDLVVAIVRLHGQRRGRAIKTHGGHVFRFDDQGRIAEAWGFTEEQGELDEFFRA
jgi:ketosteroid isomerase-like protein